MVYIASTISTTTDSLPFAPPQAKKVFFAKGYYFVFYANGAYIKYRSSSNGSSWGTEQAVSAMSSSNGNGFAICYDGGDYCYYARCPNNTTTLYYCRGTVNSNGTISWGSEVDTGLGSANATRVCNIELDTSGYALISYYKNNYPYVSRNGVANSASWSSATTWQLNSSSASVNYYSQVLPLSNRKWLAIYSGTTNGQIYSRYYDGSTLNGETGICSSSTYYPSAVMRFTAVSDSVNDIVYLGINGRSSNYRMYVYKWTTSGWGTEQDFKGATVAYTATPYLVLNTNGDLFAFWYTSSVIYHRKMTSAGTWDSSDTTDYTDSNMNNMDVSNSSLVPVNGYAILTYSTGTGSPYNCKFYALQIVTQQNKSITDEAFSIGDVSYRNKSGGLKISDSLGYNDSFLTNKTMKVSDSMSSVDSAGPRNKTIPILEALSTGDSALVGKTLKMLDSLALSVESLKKTRKLAPMNDTLSASEIVKANKSFTFSDAFNLFEALYRNRNTKVTDALTLSDILLRAGTVKLADALGLADSVITGKSLTMRDTLAITDLTRANKRFNPIAEAFNAVDSIKRNKRLTLAESLQAIDSLVNNKTLTLILDGVTQTQTLKTNKSMKLKDYVNQADTHGVTYDGINDYTTFTHASLDVQDSFTCSIRFRVNKIVDGRPCFILAGGASDNPSNGKFRIYAAANTMSYNFGIQQPGTWNFIGPTKTLELGRDYFATLQWDKPNQKFRVFIDGVQLGSDYPFTYTNLNSNSNLAIGALGQSYYWTPCTISDVSLWSEIRTQEEIQDEMSNSPNGTEANLIAYWPMNEGSGTTITDVGPNQITGNLNGAVWTQGALLDKNLLVNDALDADELALFNKTLKLSDAYHYNDVSIVGKSLKFSDVFSTTDVASRVKRSFALSDSLAANDSVVRTLRQMKIADSLALADALKLNKTLKLAESLGITDNTTIILKGNLVLITDSLTASDLMKLKSKVIPIAENVSVTEALKMVKNLIITDPFSYSDVMLLKSKSMKFSDAVSITQTLVRNKKLPITDAVTMTESRKVNKTMPLSDSLSLVDITRANKSLILNDNLEQTDFLVDSLSTYFDGNPSGTHIDSYIETKNPVNTISTNFTVEFWLYLVGGSRYNGGVLTTDDHVGLINNLGGTTGYIWYVKGYATYPNDIFRTTLNLTGTTVDRQSQLPFSIKNGWHHFAISYDGSLVADNLTYYLDSKPFKTFTCPGYLRNSTNKLRLGNITTYWLDGSMADVRVWNTTRSQADIESLINSRLEGNEDGLVFYIPLDEGSGTVANELVSGNNGTLTNVNWSSYPATSTSFLPNLVKNKNASVTDAFDMDELMLANKTFTIQDAQHVVETLFKNAKLTLQDSIHLTEAIRNNKKLKLNDTIGLADSLLVMKHILLYDVATLTEKLTVNKKLTVQEAFALNDVLNTQRHLQILDSFTADDEISQSKLFIHYHRLQAQIATISRVLGVDTISNQMEGESKQKTLDGKDSQADSLEGSDEANTFIGNP